MRREQRAKKRGQEGERKRGSERERVRWKHTHTQKSQIDRAHSKAISKKQISHLSMLLPTVCAATTTEQRAIWTQQQQQQQLSNVITQTPTSLTMKETQGMSTGAGKSQMNKSTENNNNSNDNSDNNNNNNNIIINGHDPFMNTCIAPIQSLSPRPDKIQDTQYLN